MVKGTCTTQRSEQDKEEKARRMRTASGPRGRRRMPRFKVLQSYVPYLTLGTMNLVLNLLLEIVLDDELEVA